MTEKMQRSIVIDMEDEIKEIVIYCFIINQLELLR